MSSSPAPRLTPVPFTEWDDHTRDVLLPHLRRPELYLSGAPDAPPMPVVMELFAHHLPLSETWLAFSNMLASDESTLEPCQRELVILRVAWRTQSGYEWGQHSRMGRDEGLTDEQLRAVTEGPAAEVWTPVERALLTTVDELIDGFVVSDDTWGILAGFLDPAQVFELLFVIGGYLCMAGVLNSVGLRGDPPAAP